MNHTIVFRWLIWAFPVLVALCLLPSAANASQVQAPAGFDFGSDAVLVNFLLKGDVVLSRVVASCERLNVVRHESQGRKAFEIKGFCLIKNNPQEDLDCAGYDIDASGEIDNKIQATIRKLTLSLVCSA